jgi:hypothetical protein
MPTDYKVLAQSNPLAATLTDAYTVPAAIQTIVSTITIANRSAVPTTFRISVAVGGAPDANEQYIAFDAPIPGTDTVNMTLGLSLSATDVVRVYATFATLSFNLFGTELS